ncbi:MAG: hypothetical protein H6817_05955 [Phycisphaerales bacterium]|nr:hypothetical protein [Phycisphaerales bacterium]
MVSTHPAQAESELLESATGETVCAPTVMHARGARILIPGASGFVGIIALLWISQIVDLPHRLFGTPATPFNWAESLLETLVVVIVAVVVLCWIRHVLLRIRSLEGSLHVCMYCKRVQTHERWTHIEEFITEHSEVLFSHGLCTDCLNRYHPNLLKREGYPASRAGAYAEGRVDNGRSRR